jgi:hypothetical protein
VELVSYFFKLYFNIIFLSTSRLSKLYRPMNFSNRICVELLFIYGLFNGSGEWIRLYNVE